MTPYPDREQYFWRRVRFAGNGCWEWTGTLKANGYGMVWLRDGGYVYAHRYAYAAMCGEIPIGFCVMHSCDNRKCVRPAHLSAGTQGDNIRDAVAKGRTRNPRADANRAATHCIHGHKFTPENTHRRPTGGRRCRTCDRLAYSPKTKGGIDRRNQRRAVA